jgi:hypothetical protein
MTNLLIGDDGGVCYSGTPLFSISCWKSTTNEQVLPTWGDPNHESFRKTSALKKRRIVAVGDLHGDKANSLSVLRMAGVIDAHNNWAGGDHTVFVQTVSYSVFVHNLLIY